MLATSYRSLTGDARELPDAPEEGSSLERPAGVIPERIVIVGDGKSKFKWKNKTLNQVTRSGREEEWKFILNFKRS